MNTPSIGGHTFAVRGLAAALLLLAVGIWGSANCAAQLAILPDQLEFTGCIQAGKDTATRTVRLENRSLTDSLRIDGLFTEKQIGFRPAQKSRTIAPRAFTDVEVTFTPKFPGKYTDRLIIRWSVKGVEKVAVQVNLSGQAQISWLELFPNPNAPGPKKPILDTAAVGDTTFRQLVFRNPSTCFPFIVSSVELDDGNGQFFLERAGAIPRTIPPNGFDTVLVKIVPRQTGRIQTKLWLNHHHDDWFELEVWLDVVVLRSKYLIRPRSIQFGEVPVGAVSQEQRVAISVLGADDKRFTSIQLAGADAKDFQILPLPLPYQLKRGMQDSLVIGLECAPSAVGPRWAELQLRAQDGDLLRIPISATGKDEGFAVRPRLVDVGNIAIGDTITLADTILLSKLMPPPATIPQVQVGGPDSAMFAVVGNLPASFDQTNRTHRFGVQFIPKRVGNCVAQANFLLPNNNRIRVELRGEGIATDRRLDWIAPTTNFGNVRVDSTRTLRVGLVNRGNTPERVATVAMEGAASGDFAILPLNLPATVRPLADTLWADIRFTPTASGSRTASIRATAASGATSALLMQGTGEIRGIQATPAELDFGDVVNGSSITATDTIVVDNTGTATIALTGASMEGDADNVFAVKGATDVKLAAGNQTSFSVTFAPTSVKNFSAEVVIAFSDGTPIRIPVRGRALPRPPQLRLINAPAEFGPVQINTISPPIRLGITNVGEAAATVSSVGFASNPDNVFAAQFPQATQQLGGFGADTLWISATFAPVAATPYQAEISLIGFGGTTAIQLRGEGTTNGVAADPIRLDLGAVMNKTHLLATDALLVRNRTNDPTEVTGFRWQSGDSADFTVAGQFPVTLAPAATARYSVEFFPKEIRSYQAEGMFLLNDGGAIPVTITGSGSPPPFVYLDTAYQKVNQKFDLRLYTSAFPGTAAAGGGYRARIRFNPASLLLRDVAGRGVAWQRISAGVIELSSTDPSALASIELARLTMEGLVTGKPENEVVIEEFRLLESGTALATFSGAVFLDGCQIDQAELFGRPAKINGLFPSPATAGATLRFTAPEGTHPVAVVIDPTGRDVATIPLPEGTGKETETGLTFGNVGSGFYFLELRLGTQRSVIPVMISR